MSRGLRRDNAEAGDSSPVSQAKRECIQKMGKQNFDRAFHFLWDARADGQARSFQRRPPEDLSPEQTRGGRF